MHRRTLSRTVFQLETLYLEFGSISGQNVPISTSIVTTGKVTPAMLCCSSEQLEELWYAVRVASSSSSSVKFHVSLGMFWENEQEWNQTLYLLGKIAQQINAL